MKVETSKNGLITATFPDGWVVKQRKDGGLMVNRMDGGAQVDTVYRGNSKKGKWFRVILKRG